MHILKISISLWAIAVSLLTPAAFATDVTVGCPGGQPGQYTSINAALNSLDKFGPHNIFVTGNCTESLYIADRDGVAIQVPTGAAATITAANPGDIVVQFFRARRMELYGLVIQGGSNGVLVNIGSDAIIQKCTIQNNSGDGLVAQEAAALAVEDSTMQNNGGSGLNAAAGSNVTLSSYPSQRISVNHNGFAGINVDGSFLQINFGTVTSEFNAGPGLNTNGGRLLIFGDSPSGPGNLYLNNSYGINIANGTSALIYGQNTVRSNGPVGLQVDSASLQLIGGNLPNGAPDGILIEGHSALGANITGSAEVTFGGTHTIRDNGTAGGDPLFNSGVRVSRASATVEYGTQIIGNNGPGLLSDFASKIQVGPTATITGNTGGGVRLLHVSVGDLVAPITTSQPISCDGTSIVFGNLGGLAVHCNMDSSDTTPVGTSISGLIR